MIKQCITTTLLIFLSVSAIQAAPETTSIQGKLTSSDGTPISGTRVYRVQFYDAVSGGTQIGDAITSSVTVALSGQFAIELIPPTGVFVLNELYYELAIDSADTPDGVIDADDVFANRVKVHSVLFAQTITQQGPGSGLDADTLDGLDSTVLAQAADLADKADAVHSHDGTYATITHNHNDAYAQIAHNHNGSYAVISHDHIGLYALIAHLHEGTYSPISHDHSLQNLTGSATDSQVPNDITIDQASNADTVDGKHAAELLALDGEAYVIVRTTSNAATNAANLQAAYAKAKALTPHGIALSATNRAVVIVLPGRYDFNTGSLTLDTEFVDLVGLSTARENQYLYGKTNGPNTGVVMQSASNVRIENIFIECTLDSGDFAFNKTDTGAYYPNDGLLGTTIVRNCEFKANEANAWSMRINIYYPGSFEKCTAGDYSFGGRSGVASGTFIDCIGGVYAFAGYEGIAGGTFINCTGGLRAFGGNYGLASGTFTDCTGGLWAFGGERGNASGTFSGCVGGERAFGGFGTADGTFTDCKGENYAFGGGTSTLAGSANGSFTGCNAGINSFGSYGTADGTFNDCVGGDYAFGGGNGAAAGGTFNNCTGGNSSFGGGASSEASGTFTECTGGIASFGGSGIASGQFFNCIGNRNSFGGSGGTASGVFTNCTGKSYSFGGSPGTGLASGYFTNCIGGSTSFGGGRHASAEGARFYFCRGGSGSLPDTATLRRFCDSDGTAIND